MFQENANDNVCLPYLDQWIRHQDLARDKEEFERYGNGVKDHAIENYGIKVINLVEMTESIDLKTINTYFINIFQSNQYKK